MAAAEIDVGGMAAITDSKGRFDLAIPGDRVLLEMTMAIRKAGFQPQALAVVPGSNEIELRMLRRKK